MIERQRTVDEMEEYISNSGRTMTSIAKEAGINPDTFRRYFSENEDRNPGEENLQKMKSFLRRKLNGQLIDNNQIISQEDRIHLISKIRRIEMLLFLVENELSEFRDGSKSVRDILREELDLDDAGYVTALLTNMTNERHFQQWLGANIAFNHFNLNPENK